MESLEFLSISEVAALLRVSQKTIYRLVENGSLPHARIGRSVRISRTELLSHIGQAVAHGEAGEIVE